MKIVPARQKAYVASPDKGMLATLLFGPNITLANENAKKLISALNAGSNVQVEEITPEALKENPAILTEKLSNFSLFDDAKVYFIPNATDGLTKIIGEDLSKLPDGSHIIITAGDLSTKSSLRGFFEKQERVACIACYEDDSGTLKTELRTLLAGVGKSANEDVLDAILIKLAYKRFSLKGEVEKLATYLGDENRISEVVVEEVISDNESSDFGDVSDAILVRDYPKLSQAIIAAENEGTAAISVLRGYLWFLMRLVTVKVQIEEGVPFETAIRSLHPPVFFKSLPTFRKHVMGNSTSKLISALANLHELEKNIKFQNIPQGSDALFGSLVLN